MKIRIGFAVSLLIFISCNTPVKENETTNKIVLPIQGTWKLLTGTTSDKNGTIVTDYTKDKEFIKIINDSHFAFLSHDTNKGKDSATASFSAGGGGYTLTDSLYTEHLEYCNDRQWEGNSFEFTITINNDTLIQKGIEKVEDINVNRTNIEKYIRLKK